MIPRGEKINLINYEKKTIKQKAARNAEKKSKTI